jgi:hypothetical protein
MPQLLSKVVIRIIFSTKTAIHGWTPTSDPECSQAEMRSIFLGVAPDS